MSKITTTLLLAVIATADLGCNAAQRSSTFDAVKECAAVNARELDAAIEALHDKRWSELPRLALAYPMAVGGCALLKILQMRSAPTVAATRAATEDADALKVWAEYKAKLPAGTVFLSDGLTY